jgi:hypothetical protein
LAVSAAACGVVAAPATAGGTLTPVDGHRIAYSQGLTGPAFAGSGLAWATPARPSRGGFTVTVASGGRLTERHVPVSSGLVSTALAASAEEVAFAVSVSSCADESACKYMQYEQIESSVFAAPLGERLEFRQCSSPPEIQPAVDLEGTLLAAVDGCAGGASVRDLAAGSDEPWRVYPSAGRARIAGHFLAVNLHSGGYDDAHTTIAVYDLRSGEQAYKLDPPAGSLAFDVQRDGAIAFERAVAGPGGTLAHELDMASIAQPVARRVAALDAAGDVRIASGRVAVLDGGMFRVFDLDGAPVAATSALDAVGSFDFDGDRMAFGVQPCEVAAIATWDLEGDAPALLAGRCPWARLASRVGVADLRRRTLRVEVRCPATPALGCSGGWHARFGEDGLYSSRWVALDPGEATTLRVRLSKRRVCALARSHGGRATVYLAPVYTRRPAAAGHDQPLTVRVAGKPRGCKR